MPTDCGPEPMVFVSLEGCAVVADFGGGAITSEAGAMLLGAMWGIGQTPQPRQRARKPGQTDPI